MSSRFCKQNHRGAHILAVFIYNCGIELSTKTSQLGLNYYGSHFDFVCFTVYYFKKKLVRDESTIVSYEKMKIGNAQQK